MIMKCKPILISLYNLMMLQQFLCWITQQHLHLDLKRLFTCKNKIMIKLEFKLKHSV